MIRCLKHLFPRITLKKRYGVVGLGLRASLLAGRVPKMPKLLPGLRHQFFYWSIPISIFYYSLKYSMTTRLSLTGVFRSITSSNIFFFSLSTLYLRIVALCEQMDSFQVELGYKWRILNMMVKISNAIRVAPSVV